MRVSSVSVFLSLLFIYSTAILSLSSISLYYIFTHRFNLSSFISYYQCISRVLGFFLIQTNQELFYKRAFRNKIYLITHLFIQQPSIKFLLTVRQYSLHKVHSSKLKRPGLCSQGAYGQVHTANVRQMNT